MTATLVIMNIQNEIVHPEGHIGARGNAVIVQQRAVLDNLAAVVSAARTAGTNIIYIGSGYDAQYTTLNRSVPLFADNEPNRRMQAGSWGAQFESRIAPHNSDSVLYRGGLGVFTSTGIEAVLTAPQSTPIYLAGVSTRLVVEAATFEFTDRGYPVTIIEDCCAAASAEAHEEAIKTLRLFAQIASAQDVIQRLTDGCPN